MKRTTALLPALAALLLPFLAGDLRAEVDGAPAYVDYQGMVFDGTNTDQPLGSSGTTGNYVAAPQNYTMEFRIYDAQTGTTGLIWAEKQTVTVSLGAFSVRLGSGVAIGAEPHGSLAGAFDNKDRYLELTVILSGTTGTPITPRLAFQSSPFALVAERAKTADRATSAALADAVDGTVSGDGAGLVNIPASAIVPAPPGMALIPAGEFTMGNSIAADTDITNAAPVSTTVSAFYMDVTEVTLSQWQAVSYWAEDNGYTDLAAGAGKGANHPVQTVDWYDCVKWCNARSQQAGRTPVYYTNDEQTAVYQTGNVNVTNLQVKWDADGYRLPTEAEWEKAARGGLSGQRFPWGNTISQNLANYIGNTGNYAYDQGPNGFNAIGSVGGTIPATSPVASFAANGYGLYDMAGNLLEWCWDRYGGVYAGGTDPRGPQAGSVRVLRGGGWGNIASRCRVADRNYSTPGDSDYISGFRPVRSAGQP